MNYLSICSGAEAATVAWKNLGWKCIGVSEIEKFPCAVLAHHYPDVHNFGDFTKIGYDEIEEKTGFKSNIDVLIGGTPCQSFSLAGKREGLSSENGNLALEYVELVARLFPDFFVWENVPGVFSSNKGLDFACFVGALTGKVVKPPKGGWKNAGCLQGEEDAYSVAWCSIDAQYAGLAQRRERVFVVGCPGADWRRPFAVLFDSESLFGHTPPSRKKGKTVAPCLDTSSPGNDQPIFVSTRHHEYKEDAKPSPNLEGGLGGQEAIIVMSSGQGGADPFGYLSTTLTCLHEAPIVLTPISGGWPPEIAPTLDASYSDKWGLDNQHIDGGAGLFTPIVVKTSDTGSNGSNFNEDGVAYTLDLSNGQAVLQPVVFDTGQITSVTNRSNPKPGDPCHTLNALGHVPLLIQPLVSFGIDEECNASEELFGTLLKGGEGGEGGTRQTVVQIPEREISPTLKARNDGGPDGSGKGYFMVALATDEPKNLQVSQSEGRTGSHVRRLTPKECERLQGFPDNYTRIPNWNGWRAMGGEETPESCIEEGLEVKQNKKTGKWRVKDVDGPRYKILGNSFAVPVVRWIGERIQMVHDLIMEGKI